MEFIILHLFIRSKTMDEYYLMLFVFIWALTDRQREIAVFPGWYSKLGEWFDTHYNPNVGAWWPFRTAYHTFKNIIVLLLYVLTWIFYDFMTANYVIIIWMAGQFLGLITRKKLN